MGPCQAVTQRSANKTADGHRQERQHRITGTGFEIEAAYLRHVEEKPAEEDPRNITKTEVANHECRKVPGAKDGTPRDDNRRRSCRRFFGERSRKSGTNFAQFQRSDTR